MTDEQRKELKEKVKGLPRKYAEEAIIDGQKVTIIVEEYFDYEKEVVRKRKGKIITLFGREFEVPLHGFIIKPMIVRRTGETCFSFDHGKEYMVIGHDEEQQQLYSIVDESGEDYVHLLEGFEIVREGDGPPPEGF
jgi:hypothetical protein